MTNFIVLPFVLIIICVSSYFLYRNGYLILSSKTSKKFIGSNNGKKATFSLCNGYMKRVIRFNETTTYQFQLTTELEKGAVHLELLDCNKQKILHLCNNESSTISVDKRKRYYLIIRFISATGNYTLTINGGN